MKKTFNLNDQKKKKDRVVDSIKHEIRKYIKREKNKTLPKDIDFWKMECKLSKDDEALSYVEFTHLIKSIDRLVEQEAKSINVEIVSTEGMYKNKEAIEDEKEEDELTSDV
jgi:hypothetical protein